MPIKLTCDFCDESSTLIGEWKFEGDENVDVIVCPKCYSKQEKASKSWNEWAAESEIAEANIRNKHYAIANKKAEKEIQQWQKENPEPRMVDWIALLNEKNKTRK